MRRLRCSRALLVLLLSAGVAHSEEQVDFNRDVRPLLSKHCFECHGPDEGGREADLRLDDASSAVATREGRAAIVPGDPAASELFRRIVSPNEEERMPPAEKGPLAQKEVDVLRRWIEQGAEYRRHWAFVAPQKTDPPRVQDAAWVRNPVDAFILARLERQGLTPSGQPEPRILLRRVYLDLIGLPPLPEEIAAFDCDRGATSLDEAYERVVDRLLASTEYGERWARRWLDLARYADANGYEKDRDRSMWTYRDWVIRALNADMPFDQFTIEQLAGDMLPDATLEQRVATGFHRNSMLNEEGGIDPLEFRFHAMTDRMATTGVVWLGLTLGCAQCHSHKYDPIAHAEYYQLMAFLNNADEPEIELEDAELDAQHNRNLEQADELLATLHADFPWHADPTRPREANSDDANSDEANALANQLRARFATWLVAQHGVVVDWTNLRPARATSNSPLLTILDDDSILASGDTTKRDVYEVEFAALPPGTTAIRLEAIPDPSLPNHGPGATYYEGTMGDFFLGEFRLSADGQPVHIERATHSYARNQYGDGDNRSVSAALTIDGDPQTGWSVYLGEGKRHVAVYQLGAPLPQTQRLGLTMEFGRHFASSLGRFRLAAAAERRPAEATDLPPEVEALLRLPHDSLDANQQRALWEAFLLRQPEVKERADKIAALRERPRYPRALVMRERPSHHPRPTHRHHRGEYLQPAEEATPQTPSALPPLPEGWPRNRLGLARWLVSAENPLTARVAVNRHWGALFGRGIVATLDDFGVQGAPPSHPELLDWLAVDFMEHGWSQKRLHKTLAMSAAYRQSSQANSDQLAADPDNLLLARAPRPRMEAEMIRDTALRASGLLTLKSGGPGVRPPQPSGVTEAAWGSPAWTVSVGPDRYRRSIYTFRKRTAPFAMYDAFDAPSGELCTARRDVSNTPLQALTLLNDVMFLEAAQALGALLVRHEGDDAARVRYAFERVVTRSPSDQELDRVLAFAARQRDRIARGELDPSALATGAEATAKPGDDAQQGASTEDRTANHTELAERATWTAVARALLGLDESLTRN